MKKHLIIFLLIVITPLAKADEINSIINMLGVSKTQFTTLWINSCDPKFNLTVSNSVLMNDKSIVKPGIDAGFIAHEKNGEQELIIKRGPKCEVISRYYFEGSMTEENIGEFIKKDQTFKSIYGFSVIDAWGVERYQSASMSGKVNDFTLKHWQELEQRGLITISDEESTFNGEPSKAYFSTLTDIGKAFKDAINH